MLMKNLKRRLSSGRIGSIALSFLMSTSLVTAVSAIPSSASQVTPPLTNTSYGVCVAYVTSNVAKQYSALPAGTESQSLAQLEQEFVASLCSGWNSTQALAQEAGTAVPSASNQVSTATAYTQTQSTLNFGATAFGGGTIVNLTMQGQWKYNGSDAIGQSAFCAPTSSPFPGYTYSGTYCAWDYNGGSGYLNSYALMRYLFTIYLGIAKIGLSQNYWYWLNAYTNGTHLFGCREC